MLPLPFAICAHSFIMFKIFNAKLTLQTTQYRKRKEKNDNQFFCSKYCKIVSHILFYYRNVLIAAKKRKKEKFNTG